MQSTALLEFDEICKSLWLFISELKRKRKIDFGESRFSGNFRVFFLFILGFSQRLTKARKFYKMDS